ncbi:NUDIX domain-containing protein [Streptomyces alkaliphilus]|uniref:NUDIX domain-containing protein n=1 Tax=Streptomyces alkaliphilus TaxID=1472722 RepID=UPI0034D35194
MDETTVIDAGSGTRALVVLCAAVVVHDRAAGRVVMVRRGPEVGFAPGLWDLPVGKTDRGESVSAAAVRELWEETGIRVAEEDLTLAHVVHGARAPKGPDGFVTVVFTAERWEGEPVNREPTKHDRAEWVPVGAIPGEVVLSTDRILAACVDRRPAEVSLHGWG